MSPRIVAITPGAPLDGATFSGISRRLLRALERRGALVAAVDGRPAGLVLAEKAASVSPDRTVWRQTYNAGASPLSPALRRAMSGLAGARARRAAERHGADAFVQLTGWYRPDPGRPAARASYHDGNLATFLDRPDLELDRERPGVRRALAYERSLYDAMDVILPMSDWLGRSFVEDFGQPPGKVVTAGAGPNLDVLPDPPARDWSRPRLLFVGKDWERKGGPQVLEAFARVRAEHPEAELTVIGPTALPVDPPPGVRFLGRLDRAVPEQDAALQEAFGQATAFLMPSVYEPFGIAFLEAMAYALPCFGGDSCAMPEIIEDGVTGHVVRAGDADALAGPLVALAGDPDRARAMGEAGRERMLARFTWDAVAGRIVDAVGSRVQNGAPRPTT